MFYRKRNAIKYRIGVCQLLTPHFNFYFSFIAPHNRLPDAEISRTLDRVHISNRTFITVERAQATNRHASLDWRRYATYPRGTKMHMYMLNMSYFCYSSCVLDTRKSSCTDA